MTALGPAMLATGFVVDTAAEGSHFPSAGGNSSSASVQAVYWRCIAVLFASARLTNPGLRLGLFTNADLPAVDGVALSGLFDRLAVEVFRVPLTNRLAAGRSKAWGNVLYFADVLDAAARAHPDLPFALVDSDVLVSGPVDALFDQVRQFEFVGYAVDTTLEEPLNGMNRPRLTAAVEEIEGRPRCAAITHFGGELFATTTAAWLRRRDVFADLLARSRDQRGIAGEALTEEHIWSIAFALLGDAAGASHGVLKRMWTAYNYNTVLPGDERLPLWHLPTEKRYGLRDTFAWLAAHDWGRETDPAEFRRIAGRLCGIPAKPASKIVRDGIRQVAAKLMEKFA